MSLLVFVLAVDFVAAQNTDGPRVVTENGQVQGLLAENGVEKFFGIPFAEPPVGEIRFEAPVPVSANWTETRDCSKLQHSCYQKSGLNGFANTNTPLSEDCLYLNVYRPSGQIPENLAVMVWFHGGGYTEGTANIYDPSPLVKDGNVVAVTANYRLAAFGFFYQEGKSSAVGIQDQQLALRWVKKNIRFFGGDPTRVTIFGESAGAGSLAHHIMSPTSKGLFERAILQSGTLGASWATTTIEKAKASALQLADALGCARNESVDIECLKEAPVEDIAQFMAPSFAPTPDGVVITADPFELSESIPSTNVDALLGFTTSEGFLYLMFVPPTLPVLTANYSDLSYFEDRANVAEMMFNLLGNQMSNLQLRNHSVKHLAITYEYIRNAKTPLERLKALDAACSDVHFRHGGINFAAKLANEGLCSGKVYFYEFDHKFEFDLLGPPSHLYHGAGHASDVAAMFDFELDGGGKQTGVFGSDNLMHGHEWSGRQRVIKYWTDFAKTGNPGTPFTEYNSDRRNYVHIGTDGDDERESYLGPYYNFWEEYIPSIGEFDCR